MLDRFRRIIIWKYVCNDFRIGSDPILIEICFLEIHSCIFALIVVNYQIENIDITSAIIYFTILSAHVLNKMLSANSNLSSISYVSSIPDKLNI